MNVFKYLVFSLATILTLSLSVNCGHSTKLLSIDDYKQLLENGIDNTSKSEVINGRLDVELLLKSDGRLSYSSTIMKSLKETSTGNNSYFLFPLGGKEVFRDIEISDLSSGTKKKFNEVPVLDTENCYGNYIYNEELKQILVCAYVSNSSDVRVNLKAILDSDPPDSCKPTDRISKSLQLLFSDFDNENYTYPIIIKVSTDPTLKIDTPKVTDESDKEVILNTKPIENGFLIDIQRQKISHDSIVLNMSMVGLIISEIQKVQDFQNNKQKATSKYTDQLIIALMLSFIAIESSAVNRRHDLGGLSKIAALPTFTSVLLVSVIVYTINGSANDLQLGYVSLTQIMLPVVVSSIGILTSGIIYIRQIKRQKEAGKNKKLGEIYGELRQILNKKSTLHEKNTVYLHGRDIRKIEELFNQHETIMSQNIRSALDKLLKDNTDILSAIGQNNDDDLIPLKTVENLGELVLKELNKINSNS